MSDSGVSSELIAVKKGNGKRRGRKIVKGGDLVCCACDGSPSFQTKKEMTDHKNKVHKYVKCGGCEPKKVLAFSSYKQSHLKAFPCCGQVPPTPWNKEDQCEAGWQLPKDFMKIVTSETGTDDDNSSNKLNPDEAVGGIETGSDNVEEGNNMAILSDDEEDIDYTEASVSLSANDGLCDLDESLTVQDIMKYDRMAKKRVADFSNEKDRQFEKRGRLEPDTNIQVSNCDEMGAHLALNEQLSSVEEGETAANESLLIHKIKRLDEYDSIYNVTLILGKVEHISTTPKNSFKVCRGIMQMWKCLNGCKTDDVVSTSSYLGSVETVEAILLFLHTGSGIVKANVLLKILNDNPTNLVSLYIVVMLLFCSLNSMPEEELQIVDSNISKLETCDLFEIAKLSLVWKVISCDVQGKPFPHSSSLDLEVKQYQQKFCGESFESCSRPSCTKYILNCIQQEIFQCVKASFNDASLYSRCMEYNATTSSNSFQFELMYDYITMCAKTQVNVMEQLFTLNVDPFSAELDEAFNIFLARDDGNFTLYIHEIVLRLRLGIEQACYENTLSLIRRNLAKGKKKKKRFQLKDVLQFWRLLYSDYRTAIWPENYSQVSSIIYLCVIFHLKNIPFFLFQINEPTTPTMMQYFVQSCLLTNDVKSIGRMCKLLHTNSGLMEKLKTEQLYEMLIMDSVPLTEIEVYNLVVTFSKAKPSMDEYEEYFSFKGRFQKLCVTVRFGLMNEEEFEKVDEDGYLDPNLCSAFFYNIRKKRSSTRFAMLPEDFIKPFQPRQSE